MLQGKKTRLVSVKRCNLERLRNWRNEPELRKYFREYREISPEMQEKWFQKIQNDPDQVNFEIRTEFGTKLIGHCGLYYIDWRARHAEFGVYIGNKEFRSGGYGSDALRTLFKYGFNDLNLNKIHCEVYSNNASYDVYRHLGFKDEGVLRQHYFSEGQYWDSKMMSLLRDEYESVE